MTGLDGQRDELVAMQQKNQPGAIDALDRMCWMCAEDVGRRPAERRRLPTKVLQEAAGVGDDLLPTGGADARRASNYTELQDALDPIGEQWIGLSFFSVAMPKCQNCQKSLFGVFDISARGKRERDSRPRPAGSWRATYSPLLRPHNLGLIA